MSDATPVFCETKAMRIVSQDRRGRQTIEKMINDGWDLLTKDDSLIMPSGIYTFRRSGNGMSDTPYATMSS